MRKFLIITLCAFYVVLALFLMGRAQEARRFNELLRKCEETGAKNIWKKIDWQKDAASALAKAQNEDKPIFVLFEVNKGAKKGAGEC